MVPILPVPPELAGEDLSFTGHPLPPDIARAVAAGDLDPATRLPFDGPSGLPQPTTDAAADNTTPANSSNSISVISQTFPTDILGKGTSSSGSIQSVIKGLGCRQATITSLFGRRAGSTPTPPHLVAAARAASLPPVSEDASRDFRPPRPVGAGEVDGEDALESSRGASPPAAGPGRDNDSACHAPLKRSRGWTANPFASSAKKLASVAAIETSR